MDGGVGAGGGGGRGQVRPGRRGRRRNRFIDEEAGVSKRGRVEDE